MKVLDHLVLSLNILFNSVQVFRSFPKVFLLLPVNWLIHLLGVGKDVLNSVGHNEIFVGLQSLDWLIRHLWHAIFFVLAVIGEVSN